MRIYNDFMIVKKVPLMGTTHEDVSITPLGWLVRSLSTAKSAHDCNHGTELDKLNMFFNRITIEEIVSPLGTISPILRESPLFIVIFLVLFAAGVYVQYIASKDFDFENIKLFERWSAANR